MAETLRGDSGRMNRADILKNNNILLIAGPSAAGSSGWMLVTAGLIAWESSEQTVMAATLSGAQRFISG